MTRTVALVCNSDEIYYGENTMKRFTTLVFAALIALTLSMPALAQGTTGTNNAKAAAQKQTKEEKKQAAKAKKQQAKKAKKNSDKEAKKTSNK